MATHPFPFRAQLPVSDKQFWMCGEFSSVSCQTASAEHTDQCTCQMPTAISIFPARARGGKSLVLGFRLLANYGLEEDGPNQTDRKLQGMHAVRKMPHASRVAQPGPLRWNLTAHGSPVTEPRQNLAPFRLLRTSLQLEQDELSAGRRPPAVMSACTSVAKQRYSYFFSFSSIYMSSRTVISQIILAAAAVSATCGGTG